MRVVILDGLALRCSAYATLFESWAASNGFCIAQVSDAKALPSKSALTTVVLGAHLISSAEGKSLLRTAIRDTHGPVAAIVERHTSECVSTAFDLDLKGTLLLTEAPSVICAALGFIIAGGNYIPHVRNTALPQSELSYLPQRTAARTVDKPVYEHGGKKICGNADLTRRQFDVLRFLANGDSNKEIARELDLSEATVKSHVRQVMRKLTAANRTQAALFARDLLETPQSDVPATVSSSGLNHPTLTWFAKRLHDGDEFSGDGCDDNLARFSGW
jgi:DNA-binding NarL/FixJ family response regulator